MTNRMDIVEDRLAFVTNLAAPDLDPEVWELVCRIGWGRLVHQRNFGGSIGGGYGLFEADREAWDWMVMGVGDWIKEAGEDAPAWTSGLVRRLSAMPWLQRIAVLERCEAYGRAQALQRDEVNVTPEMIEAGATLDADMEGIYPLRQRVEAVYRAMETVRRQQKARAQ